MTVTSLSPAPGASAPEPFAGADHPMRKITRQVAFEGLWDATRAAKVAALFDGMAAEWAERVDPAKGEPIRDALRRGDLPTTGQWLELGSGTGAGTSILAPKVERLVALDLSAEMLAHAPGDAAPRVRGDGSALPFADDAFDVVMMVNMLLFPDEIGRVLRGDGAVLWINTLGDQTPIHLSPDDVVAALPGEWAGCTAAAGTGFWTVLRRR